MSSEPAVGLGGGGVAWIAIGAVLIGVAAAGLLLFPRGLRERGPESSEPAEGAESARTIPEFRLRTSDGREIGPGELRGRPYVVDFFFTACPICAAMSEGFQRLQRDLPSEVRLLSISVDPANDTPERLAEYATRYAADPERWWFLRGPIEDVRALMESGFGLSSASLPASHSTRFALVDAEGRLRGTWNAMDVDAAGDWFVGQSEYDRLVDAARTLVEEAR